MASGAEEEPVWQLSFRGSEPMESGPCPERPGEPNCAYYIRTGFCGFGMSCKFHHPSNRMLAAANARIMAINPERFGQPECQHYLKTGACKFGATCKFHHPKDKAGLAGRAQLNIFGYPVRPNVEECAYYMRTLFCKFGSTCKFHHPEPSDAMVSVHDSSAHAALYSTIPSKQHVYSVEMTNWPLTAASFIPSPRWQNASSYTQLILPQGFVQVPGWNPYPGRLISLSFPERQQQSPGAARNYSNPIQREARPVKYQESIASYGSMPVTSGDNCLKRDHIFPDRPDQPECQFYMKTGDCKYGMSCKFHHPKGRLVPVPNCMLSPLGLPLRPGEPLCIFYSRYRICKFGPNCKFDHPMGNFSYSTSTVSAADAHNILSSSSKPPAQALSLEER